MKILILDLLRVFGQNYVRQESEDDHYVLIIKKLLYRRDIINEL